MMNKRREKRRRPTAGGGECLWPRGEESRVCLVDESRAKASFSCAARAIMKQSPTPTSPYPQWTSS